MKRLTISRTLKYLAVLILAVMVAGVILAEPILSAIGSYLVHAEAPVEADIAIVLAGDISGRRILRAAELVEQGFVPNVLVSGPEGFYGAHECDLAIPFAVEAGFPESYFLHFENQALSTADEAQMLPVELRRLGVHDILLVTSNFHTRRAGRMFREAAPDLNFIVIAAPDVDFTPDGWWKSRQGQKAAFFEWTKTVASWFNI